MGKELLLKLKKEFEKTKKEFGFKASYKQIEEIFFISDLIQEQKYVSESFIRQLSHRIIGLYNNWYSYLHGLIIPNPNSMVNVIESQAFEDEEKEDIQKLMNKIMVLTSKNSIIGLNKSKKEQANFIDDSVSFWDDEMKNKLEKYMIHVNKTWKNR